MLFNAIYRTALLYVCALLNAAPVRYQPPCIRKICGEIEPPVIEVAVVSKDPVIPAPTCDVPPRIAAKLPEPSLAWVISQEKGVWRQPSDFHSPTPNDAHHDSTRTILVDDADFNPQGTFQTVFSAIKVCH